MVWIEVFVFVFDFVFVFCVQSWSKFNDCVFVRFVTVLSPFIACPKDLACYSTTHSHMRYAVRIVMLCEHAHAPMQHWTRVYWRTQIASEAKHSIETACSATRSALHSYSPSHSFIRSYILSSRNDLLCTSMAEYDVWLTKFFFFCFHSPCPWLLWWVPEFTVIYYVYIHWIWRLRIIMYWRSLNVCHC